MNDIVFWGGTGQAKVLNDAIANSEYRLVAIIDNEKLPVSPVHGVPTLHGIAELDEWLMHRRTHGSGLPFGAVAVGGAKGRDRLNLMHRLQQKGIRPLSIVHNTAFVAHDAELGKGVQILAMSAVCSSAKIGDGVIINTAALVDHDCVIGDGVHIGPGAKLAGGIVVSKFAFVGTGAVILPRLTVGEGAIVGAGAVVTKDVLPHVTVVGNPARVMKIY